MEDETGIAPLPIVVLKAEKCCVNADLGPLLVHLVRITWAHSRNQWHWKWIFKIIVVMYTQLKYNSLVLKVVNWIFDVIHFCTNFKIP